MEDGTVRDIQTQAVAVGDGKDYKKYEKNPVLTAKDLPEGASKVDFRDPKIWKGKDGELLLCYRKQTSRRKWTDSSL